MSHRDLLRVRPIALVLLVLGSLPGCADVDDPRDADVDDRENADVGRTGDFGPAEAQVTTLGFRLDQAVLDPCDEPLQGPQANEVHDCQRLLVENAGRDEFGPLVAVRPVTPAMSIPDAGPSFDEPQLMAVVVNHSATETTPSFYPDLEIDEEVHCLWIRRPGSWSAAMVGGTGCWNAPAPPASEFTLEAEPLRFPTAQPADYPGSARWGWDSLSTRSHYIGIRCGPAWCVVGKGGFQHYENLTGGPVERLVPGWFDRQHLAIEDSSYPHGLRPGPWGAIYPAPGYRQADTTAIRQGVLAAALEVDPGSADFATYATKFNLRQDGGGFISLAVDVQPDLNQGLARYQRAGNPQTGDKPAVIQFVKHLQHGAPGSVRWRWLSTDEGPWISCRVGCCYAQM